MKPALPTGGIARRSRSLVATGGIGRVRVTVEEVFEKIFEYVVCIFRDAEYTVER